MILSNCVIHKNISFEDYLKIPGYSYSGIRAAGADFVPTAKMQLGTDVHNYLLTPEQYKYDNVAIVKPLALALKAAIGPLLAYLQPELAVTANFVHEGFSMAYKGRIDLGIPGRLVVDIKVSEMDIAKAVEFFGYDHQLSGYEFGISAKAAIIISINPKTKQTKITKIPTGLAWWEYQVKQKGEAL